MDIRTVTGKNHQGMPVTISLREAYDELRKALAAPEDDVFYDIIAISDRLLASDLVDRDIEAWAADASLGIRARGIAPDKLTCYRTLDTRLSDLVFHIVDTELAALWPARALPNLLSVHLGSRDIEWNAMPDCHWRWLTKISIQSGPGISRGLLPWLARQELPALAQLLAERINAPGAELIALSRARFWGNLEVLSLGYNPIDMHREWPAMPHLRALRMPSTRTTNEGLHRLLAAPLPLLEELDISGNPIDNHGFDFLVGKPLPALSSLVARGCQFSDGHAWQSLACAAWPRLRRLDLQDSVCDPEMLHAASPVLRALHELVLASSELDDRGLETLLEIGLPDLVSLVLSFNRLTAAGMSALAAAELPRLSHLHVSANPLGDKGVLALTRCAWWRSLETIGLVNVDMTDEGLRALAQVIPAGLREIYIRSREPFSTEAMEQLRRLLPKGATIR